MPSVAPVYVKKGYDLRAFPQKVYPDESGVVHIEIREVERVALSLNLDPSALSYEFLRRDSDSLNLSHKNKSQSPTLDSGFTYSGYLKFQDELRPLPIGSTLDPTTGLFTWQPGPGFLGEYELVFVRQSPASQKEKITVRINIIPQF